MEFVALYVAVILLILGLAGGGVALAVTFPFGRELEQWRREGLVSDDQARVLAERHDVAARRERRRRIARALAIAGAITLGLGIILFFAANWSDIPKFGRLAVLLAFLVAFLVAGYVLRIVHASRPALGHAFLFVGSMLFGASIFLVAQIYHWDVASPRPFLVWAAGALAIAVVGRADLSAGLSALAFATWIIYRTFEAGAGDESSDAALIPILLALYGTALYGLGTGLEPWLDRVSLGTAIRYVGFTTAFLALFALTFREFGLEAQRSPQGAAEAVVIVLAVAAALGALLVATTHRRDAAAATEGLTLAAVIALVLVFAFAPEHGDEREVGLLTAYPLAFTFLLVALTFGAIVVGFLNDEAWLVNAAIVFAALQLIARFVDDSWPTLERSFVFAGVGGVALVIAAALERRRSGTAARQP